MNKFIHVLCDFFTGSWAIVRLPNALEVPLIMSKSKGTKLQQRNIWPEHGKFLGCTLHHELLGVLHDAVIKWKHFPRYWSFVREIHRSPVNSPQKGQWRGALVSSLMCTWINAWVNNREAGDLRRNRSHYNVIVMVFHQKYMCFFAMYNLHEALHLI